MVLDELPGGESPSERCLVAEVLVHIEEPHDSLCLHPPVEVGVAALVDHGAVGQQSPLARHSHLLHDGFQLMQHIGIAQHQRSLVQQPGAFDVVAVALRGAHARPVHLEEEVEVVGGGVEDALGEEGEQAPDGTRYHGHGSGIHAGGGRNSGSGINAGGRNSGSSSAAFLQRAQEVGVRLNDVKVGVLALGVVLVLVGEPHVTDGLPVARASLDVASVDGIPGVALDVLEEVEGDLQRLVVARGSRVLREPVYGETDGVELLLRVQRTSQVVHGPVNATLLAVEEMAEEVVLGARGSLETALAQVLTPGVLLGQHAAGCRERPEDAGIQDSTFLGLGMQRTVAVHATVPAAMLVVLHLVQPERQYVLRQALQCLGAQLADSGVH